MKQFKFLFILSLGMLLAGCEQKAISESSIWVICDQYEDVCNATHSGALCSVARSDTIRALARHKDRLSSINAYDALVTLDNYKACLEDAFVSENIRRKKDKQSQMNTIRNIPELQQAILADSQSLVRPEVNLWLWQKSQDPDYLESMINGVEIAEQVHADVYVALMMESAERAPEQAREYAQKAMQEASVISDVDPRVYEFYIGYYLDHGNVHKAAVWQGLYSALDEEQARINAAYFKLYQQMNEQQIASAREEVEDLLFDARWLKKDISAFPQSLR